MAKKGYDAGVKEYRDTYWMPEYEPKDTDILHALKLRPNQAFQEKRLQPLLQLNLQQELGLQFGLIC